MSTLVPSVGRDSMPLPLSIPFVPLHLSVHLGSHRALPGTVLYLAALPSVHSANNDSSSPERAMCHSRILDIHKHSLNN